MISALKNRVEARNVDGADRADIVQTVLLIAGFAVVAILVVGWVGTAILGKGADAANCIEGSSSYSGSSDAEAACEKGAGMDNEKSFKDDSGYQSRFGN